MKRGIAFFLGLSATGWSSWASGPFAGRLGSEMGADPCFPLINPIACENSHPGNPASEWDVVGDGDPNIQGFATDISFNRGEIARFKINTPATAYHLDIYRMGYYRGMGARWITRVEPSATLPQVQQQCTNDETTGLIDCGVWDESASWFVPADATSGIYFAKLVRDDAAGASHIVFVVRDDASQSDILFQTSDLTWQAYNVFGGNSLYTGSPPAGRAYKVSYNRPFNSRVGNEGADWVFGSEYPMVRFLEANGYDMSYASGVDSDRSGERILQHRALLSVGHDEYWSGGQRTNVEIARGQGVHLAFFSGNEVFWKTRWEPSIDGWATPHRTLVCYKETHADAKIDPDPAWTGTWRDPRFSPPSDGGRPENALTGTLFRVSSPQFDTLMVPAEYGRMRFWRNTSVALLQEGQMASISSGCNCTLGYEWDEDQDNGFRPSGLIRLSSSTWDVDWYLRDYGTRYSPGRATHHLTLYRAASGALVFGAGTVNWSWGLDGSHDRMASIPDVRLQQATVNLFGDMGIQPGTLQPSLVPATASTDTLSPLTFISSPAEGGMAQAGVELTVTGTAADRGGGVVGGVELSIDGGATWHPATAGRENWTYLFRPGQAGPLTILSRAVDDSGNIGPSAEVHITVTPRACPCGIWRDSTVPEIASFPDTLAIEVGVKFQLDVDGSIVGLRFYKGPSNTGPHIGNLWTGSGTLLRSAVFGSETPTGWQQVIFDAPVPVFANTTYVASYHSEMGGYSADLWYFTPYLTGEYVNPPLRAHQDGADGGNGVLLYGESGFPTIPFAATNYWVDVLFSPASDKALPFSR